VTKQKGVEGGKRTGGLDYFKKKTPAKNNSGHLTISGKSTKGQKKASVQKRGSRSLRVIIGGITPSAQITGQKVVGESTSSRTRHGQRNLQGRNCR